MRRGAKPLTKEKPGTPVLSRRTAEGRLRLQRPITEPRRFDVGISSIATVCGSRLVPNSELLSGGRCGGNPTRTAEDIVQRTGIESRQWVAPGENPISLAVRASWEVLDREHLLPTDLDVVICSTTSPTAVAPSMACQVLQGLAAGKSGTWTQAYDIHAACSGYLYALQAGFDFLQSTPTVAS